LHLHSVGLTAPPIKRCLASGWPTPLTPGAVTNQHDCCPKGFIGCGGLVCDRFAIPNDCAFAESMFPKGGSAISMDFSISINIRYIPNRRGPACFVVRSRRLTLLPTRAAVWVWCVGARDRLLSGPAARDLDLLVSPDPVAGRRMPARRRLPIRVARYSSLTLPVRRDR